MSLGFTPAGAADETPAARSFSADIVSRVPGEAAVTIGRIHVSERQVRIDTVAAPSGYFLVRGAGAFFVRPTMRVFMDARLSTPLTQVFIPLSPQDPCPEWRAAATNAGGSPAAWQCEAVQDPAAAHGGKREFRVMSTDRHLSRRWIDAALDFPVKLLNTDGATIALEHIRVEVQPSALFALPPDYRKCDPNALIERIKRSDVWAGP